MGPTTTRTHHRRGARRLMMILRYRLQCGHVIHITQETLPAEGPRLSRRAQDPAGWWCRRCGANIPVACRMGWNPK